MQRKIILFSLLTLFLNGIVHAQPGCHIQVKLIDYKYDTLWFGHTVGKRAVPDFFGIKNADGFFELKTEAALPSGMHAIIHKRTATAPMQYIQCWLPETGREFKLTMNLNNPYNGSTVSGSPDNQALHQYRQELDLMETHVDTLTDAWRHRQDEVSFRSMIAAQDAMLAFQQNFIKNHPDAPLTNRLIEQTMYRQPPAAEVAASNWQAEADRRWAWHRTHFFDQMDISGPDFLKYPQWLDRTDYFLFHLPPPSPDTARVLIDYVFKKLENSPEALKYYQKYLTNSLSRMSRFRLDEVFVYVLKTYAEPSGVFNDDQENLQKHLSDARRMEPLFVGKKAPNLTLTKKDGESVNLYGLEAPATLLIFWLPDCSHCKKEMPLIKTVYEKFKARGLKVVSVCGKYQDDTPQCWEFADAQQMPADWLVVSDPQRRSNMANLYNLRSFPRIFILDAGKNIRYKRAGEASELELTSELERAIGKVGN